MLYLIKANLMIRNRLRKCSVAEMISLRSKVSKGINLNQCSWRKSPIEVDGASLLLRPMKVS